MADPDVTHNLSAPDARPLGDAIPQQREIPGPADPAEVPEPGWGGTLKRTARQQATATAQQ
jgi:hypothetical protein